jgi:putative hydrolase of the HAD superfamily
MTIAAVLLDFGGTLDGDGLHWLDRFQAIYAGCEGLAVSPLEIKNAFYEADRRLLADSAIGTCGFREMMRRHAMWQLRGLGLDDAGLAERLAEEFTGPAEEALRQNRPVLQRLRDEGYRLGVVSNFYGNVAALCEEAGLATLLDVIIDSAVIGLCKPDPGIFAAALSRLEVAAGEAVMVGDSFERDMRPARMLGIHTLWLAPGREVECPDPTLVDGVIRSLADLPERLRAIGAAARPDDAVWPARIDLTSPAPEPGRTA